jgi:hypothetical protein
MIDPILILCVTGFRIANADCKMHILSNQNSFLDADFSLHVKQSFLHYTGEYCVVAQLTVHFQSFKELVLYAS